MSKARDASSDIDRLIEMGLNRYGAGDLDGAVLLWEEALAVDPNNTRASSYVDYVRLNYDLLTGEPSVEEVPEAAHPIEEEPGYQIEGSAGASGVASSVVGEGEVDDGWFSGEETQDAAAASAPSDGAARTLELEADEPPPPPEVSFELEADEPPPAESDEPNLDDGTAGPTMAFFRGDEVTEYGALDGRSPISGPPPDEFGDEPSTAGFNPQGTPLGFSNLETEIRKRDFGFVQATAPAAPARNKTPTAVALGSAPTQDNVAFEATVERGPFQGDAHGGEATASDDELLASLPVPQLAEPEESGEIRFTPGKHMLADVGRAPTRLPSEALSQAEVTLPHAPTRELTPNELRHADNPLISAPTREIGTRPGSRPLANPDDDDVPTKQSDVRAIRAAHARFDGAAARDEVTQPGIEMVFDPIVTANARILDEVDIDTPEGESREDQTRRRISRLLEKAGDWADVGDMDRAIAAVDLALEEDPTSALAQKLITRNKETIMQLFQGYLGDLDRTPHLAKPLHELANEQINSRAAFLLSRIDGMLTIDELLDVSGMPRLEAYRHLCQLFLRGILR